MCCVNPLQPWGNVLSAQQKCFGRLMLVPGKPEGFLICQAGVWGKREPPCLGGGGGGVGRGISLRWMKDMKAEPGIPCDFIRLYG